MLPDRVSNPGPLTYESGALPIALRGPAGTDEGFLNITCKWTAPDTVSIVIIIMLTVLDAVQ